MFKLQIDSEANFRRFLGTIDTDWVTVILADKTSLFVEDSNEVFAIYQVLSVVSASESATVFRLKKDILELICAEGMLEIEVSNDSVVCTMVGEKVRREVTVTRHQAFVSAFREKLGVIQDGKSKPFNALSLKSLIDVTKAMHSFVEVYDGIAGVITKDGTQVYQKTGFEENFCLSAQAASALFRCGYNWHCSKQYLYTVDGSFGVLATQCRGSGIWSYDLISGDRTGAAFVADIDIKDLVGILRHRSKSALSYNVRGSYFKIVDDSGASVYRIMAPRENCNIADAYSKDEIPMNPRVILDVVAKIGTTINLVIKKAFLRITVGDCIIICK